MDKHIEKLWDYVTHGQNISIENQLFRLITLFVSLLSLFLILPTNLLQNLPPYLNMTVVIYGFATGGLYLVSRRGYHYVKTFFVMTLILLSVAWFLNAGSQGSIGYFFFAAVLYPLIFFRGLTRQILLLMIVLDYCALMIVEFSYPASIIPFKSSSDRLIDLVSGFSFSTLTSALVFWVVVSTLERELRDRRQAEELLRQSDEQYRQLFDNMLNGIMVVDVIFDEAGAPCDYRFVHGNPAFEKLTGIKAKDQIGKTGEEMAIGWPPDIVQRLFNVAITGEPIQYERYNETLDRYYDTRVFAPHYGQFAHIFSDITERKRTEITNERFRISQKAILDNLPMMAWLKDTESRLEMVNEPYAKACGHTVLECIGKTDLDLFPAEMAQGYMADDFEVCTSGRQKQVEELISTPIGEKWHLTYKTPIFDELGHIIGTAGIAQDITERKQAEVELRNSKENYRAIVDAFDGMLYICSQDYQILYLNNKMIERIGHNAVGEKCFNALHGLDDVCPWCVNERILQGEAVRWEVKVLKTAVGIML